MGPLISALKRPSDAATAAGFVGLLAVPLVMPSYQVTTWAVFLTFAMLALAIDLVWGYTGLLTLGHAAFFGAGAYIATKLLKNVPAIPDIAVVFLIAPLFAALCTFVLGWYLFSADVKGSYFAITTLIIAIVFERIAGEFVGFLGGFNGIYGIPSITLAGFEFTAVLNYYLALGVLSVFFVGSRLLVSSAFGRVLRGIRGNQDRTEMLGYKTDTYRLIIFTISGAMVGIAGALYATIDGFVSPPLLGFVLSTEAVIWVAVGGRGTLVGAVLGSLLIQYLNNSLSDVLVNYWQLALAAIFIFVVFTAPRGIVGFLKDLTERAEATAAQPEESGAIGGDHGD